MKLVLNAILFLFFFKKAQAVVCETKANEGDCSHRNISNLNQLKNWSDLNSSVYLNFFGNNFEQIPLLENFGHLQVLNLSSNKIKYIDEIKHIPITVLDLDKNLFTSMPWELLFNHLTLDIVYMRHNPIHSVNYITFFCNATYSEFCRNVIHIKELYLSHCRIHSLNLRVFDLFDNLKILDLSWNNIKTIDPAVGILIEKKLPFRILHLHDNPLECSNNLLWLRRFYFKRRYKTPTICHDHSKGEFNHTFLENFQHVEHRVQKKV